MFQSISNNVAISHHAGGLVSVAGRYLNLFSRFFFVFFLHSQSSSPLYACLICSSGPNSCTEPIFFYKVVVEIVCNNLFACQASAVVCPRRPWRERYAGNSASSPKYFSRKKSIRIASTSCGISTGNRQIVRLIV